MVAVSSGDRQRQQQRASKSESEHTRASKRVHTYNCIQPFCTCTPFLNHTVLHCPELPTN